MALSKNKQLMLEWATRVRELCPKGITIAGGGLDCMLYGATNLLIIYNDKKPMWRMEIQLYHLNMAFGRQHYRDCVVAGMAGQEFQNDFNFFIHKDADQSESLEQAVAGAISVIQLFKAGLYEPLPSYGDTHFDEHSGKDDAERAKKQSENKAILTEQFNARKKFMAEEWNGKDDLLYFA